MDTFHFIGEKSGNFWLARVCKIILLVLLQLALMSSLFSLTKSLWFHKVEYSDLHVYPMDWLTHQLPSTNVSLYVGPHLRIPVHTPAWNTITFHFLIENQITNKFQQCWALIVEIEFDFEWNPIVYFANWLKST